MTRRSDLNIFVTGGVGFIGASLVCCFLPDFWWRPNFRQMTLPEIEQRGPN